MQKPIDKIPRKLNKKNIEKAIRDYFCLLEKFKPEINSKNVLNLITNLKREEIDCGPYPKVTFFESANRILSDLTILFGIQDLLNGKIPEIDFEKYCVEYGNENNNDYDIIAKNSQTKLIGEGFNVAKSFFQTKKSYVLRKMRKEKCKNVKRLIIYNSDAVPENYVPKLKLNEYHLKVDLDLNISPLVRLKHITPLPPIITPKNK